VARSARAAGTTTAVVRFLRSDVAANNERPPRCGSKCWRARA